MRISNFFYNIILSYILCAFICAYSAYATDDHLPRTSESYFRSICPTPKQAGNPEFASQFYEDYILAMVFSDFKTGRYIDVGAYAPSHDSVTHYFYKRGWHGINIEPIKELHAKFVEKRKNDINLNIGISDQEGEIDFYRLSSEQLSTGNPEYAKKAEAKGYTYTTHKIPVTTLNKVLYENPMPSISFMKIDVEGMEKEVLASIDLETHRPMVILIESIMPFSHKEVHDSWEHYLTKNRYEFVYFDSLNSYYVAREHLEHLSWNFAMAEKCHRLANELYPEWKLEHVFANEKD